MPGSATQMYAKNLQTLINHLMADGNVELNFDDEITKGATITHGGKVVHEATAKALGLEVEPAHSPATRPMRPEPATSAQPQTKDA